MKSKIIIVSQSLYQTLFWVKIAQFITNKIALDIIFVCFDYESEIFLKNKNFKFFNLNNIKFSVTNSNIQQIIKKYKIKNIEEILFHHINYYSNYSNKKECYTNFFIYINCLEKIFEKSNKQNTVFIQELGGFASNIACYFFSQHQNINNFFVEPSFFLNHVHFLKNTFKCEPISNSLNSNMDSFFNKYLANVIENKQLNIPSKDAAQFQNPINKIFNRHNIKRFFLKIYYKYFLKQRSEFNLPFIYSLSVFKNYISYLRIKKLYLKLSKLKNNKYIYFPLHVPNDLALTLRARKYYNQLNFIEELIAKTKKFNIDIVIKEHPARIGAINASKILNLKKKYENLKILKPWENTYNIIEKSMARCNN